MVGLPDLFGSGDRLSIDFGTSSLKIAQLRSTSSNSVEFGLCDKEPVDRGEGELVDVYGDALRALLNRNGLSGGQSVMISLPTDSVIVRHMELPAMDDERISKVVKYEAESNIPFPIQSVVMDYHVLEKTDESTRILLVVVKKDRLENYMSVLRKVDFEPEVVEITSFSLFNIFRKLTIDPNGSSDSPGVLVDVGHSSTDIIIFQGNSLRYARSASVGGESIIEAISDELGVDEDEATRLLHEHGHLALDGVGTSESDEPMQSSDTAPPPPDTESDESMDSDSPPPPPGDTTKTDSTDTTKSNPPEADSAPAEPGPPQSEEETKTQEPPPPPSGDNKSEEELGSPEPPSPPPPDTDKEDSAVTDEAERESPSDQDQDNDGESSGDPTESSDDSDALSLDMPEPESTHQDLNDDQPEQDSSTSNKAGDPAQPPESPGPSSDEGSDLFLGASEEEMQEDTNEEENETGLMGAPDEEQTQETGSSSEDESPLDSPDTTQDDSSTGAGSVDRDSESVDEPTTESDRRSPAEGEEDGEDDLGDLSLGNLRKPEDDEEDEKNDLGAAANPSPEPPDEESVDREAIAEVIETEVNRLIGELRQTFDYFQSEMSGGEIDQVILCGGASQVRNFPTYVEEEMNRSTRRFEPESSIKGLKGNNIHSMLVSAGLGLRSLEGESAVSINLIPESLREERESRQQQQKYTLLGVVALVLIVQFFGWCYLKYKNQWRELQRSKEVLKKVQPIVSRVKELEKIKKKLDTRLSIVQRLEQNQVRVLPVLDTLNKLPMMKNTWMRSVSIKSKKKQTRLKLTGITADYQNVSKFDDWMQEQEFVQKKVANSQSQKRTTVQGKSMVQFNISYELNFKPINKTRKVVSKGSERD